MAFKQAAGTGKGVGKGKVPRNLDGSNVRVSLRPDNYGGGMGFDDFDGTIVSAVWEKYDRDGQDDEVIAVALTLHNDEVEDGEYNPFVRYYKAGQDSVMIFDIVNDGYHLAPNAAYAEEHGMGIEDLRLPKRCGAASLLISAIDAGADEDLIETEGLQSLEGSRWHFKNVEKTFKDRQTKKQQSYEQLLIESRLEEAAPQPPKVQARVAAATARPASRPTPAPQPKQGVRPAQPQPKAPVVPEVDGVDMANEYVLAKLAENGGVLTAGRLTKGVMPYGRQQGWDQKLSNKVLVLVGDEEFLGQEGMGWTFDGENVTAE